MSTECGIMMMMFKCMFKPWCVYLQYSQKEDKYEEEIKILTDKLKEVRRECGEDKCYLF